MSHQTSSTTHNPHAMLCTTCYESASKYRCPACNTRTCSLTCFGIHKTQKSCSGTSSPARYIPKQTLRNVDWLARDYQFLRGVEDAIEKGVKIDERREKSMGEEKEDEEGNMAPQTSVRGSDKVKELIKYLRKNEISVERAPAGMSRHRVNQTRGRMRRGVLKVHWTVEWVYNSPEGKKKREIRHGVHSELRVVDAWTGRDGFQGGGFPGKDAPVEDDKGGKIGHSLREGDASQSEDRDPTQGDAPSLGKKDNLAESQPRFFLQQSGKGEIPLCPKETFTEALKCRAVKEFPTIRVEWT
ncbi:hypothetical protein K470DRAFT_257353 [Piedraia hortae CBS 480.64]|uniref:HIT-type domain-containing protein n=1 Tax=Piedraia hortae CBS 480.64 TaxID=1314780 RepID=A0A6A7C0H3_9PEZI|nr:hypothetical protein K470DRAFT_257353 [Piedraia hortae CBS 480.64]